MLSIDSATAFTDNFFMKKQSIALCVAFILTVCGWPCLGQWYLGGEAGYARHTFSASYTFAVGEPELFVEMVMPRAQFDEFCAMQGVQPTQGRLPEQADGSAAHEWDWSLRDARERHFRHEP